MEIFKLTTRDTWHIIDKRHKRQSYCHNARTHNYVGDEPVKNLETITEVYGNNFPKLCKACVQHAYEDDVIEISVKE